MEGAHRQPEGARNEISSHDEPVVYDRSTAETHPPLTFAEAERHNAYALLTELHDHALTVDAAGERRNDPQHHLAELALSNAVVAWWSRWQPIMMHRALKAGASLDEVAAAAGLSETEAYGRWSRWAERQTRLVIGERRGLDPAEADAVREHVRRTATDDNLALLEGPQD